MSGLSWQPTTESAYARGLHWEERLRRVLPPPIAYGFGHSSKATKDQEDETLLKLIAAMAIKPYAFDRDAKRNQVTAHIQSTCFISNTKVHAFDQTFRFKEGGNSDA